MSRRATKARAAILRAMARDLLPDLRLTFASESTASRWREWAQALRSGSNGSDWHGLAHGTATETGDEPVVDAEGAVPLSRRAHWRAAVLPPIEIPQLLSGRLEPGRLATGWGADRVRARGERSGSAETPAPESATARVPRLDAIATAISERIATQPLLPSPVLLPTFVPPTTAQRLRGAFRYGERVVADAVLWAFWQVRSLFRSPVPWYPGDAASKLPTVVLLPGLATNWKFMEPLADALADAGFPVVQLPQLRRVTKPSSDLAELVLRYLRTHRELGPVLLVSHSKGGLVAKRVLLADPEAKLALGAVTISAPFDGARAARFVRGGRSPFREVVLMRPGTPAMLELARQTSANSRITTVSPIIDEIVGSRGTLPGARNLAVSSIGHNLLLADPRVHRLVVRELHRVVDAAAARAKTNDGANAPTEPIELGGVK